MNETNDAAERSAACSGYPSGLPGPWSMSTNSARYRRACEQMGTQLFSSDRFISAAMRWLSEELGDFHLEYHRDCGWRSTSCHSTCLNGQWSEDGWVEGDGTLCSALLAAVEATLRHTRGERLHSAAP